MAKTHIAPTPRPGSPRIFTVREHRVILDSDLAQLYGVPLKRLNQQVRRNQERFPDDFAFTLSAEEWQILRLQNESLSSAHGKHRKFQPYVFTEHGVLMAAGVLNSGRAIEVSIYIARTFVAMRDALANTRKFSKKLDALERRLESRLIEHDQAIADLLGAIRELMKPPQPPRRPIGFS